MSTALLRYSLWATTCCQSFEPEEPDLCVDSKQLQEANARLEAELAEMELAPVQRKIEARSSDDSFTGLVRVLYFADTFLTDSE